jgi:hypothetical protein
MDVGLNKTRQDRAASCIDYVGDRSSISGATFSMRPSRMSTSPRTIEFFRSIVTIVPFLIRIDSVMKSVQDYGIEVGSISEREWVEEGIAASPPHMAERLSLSERPANTNRGYASIYGGVASIL